MKSADWLGEMFERIDAKDVDGFVEYFAEDAQFRFGNAPAVSGVEAIGKAVGEFFATIKGMKHTIRQTWEHPDAVIWKAR